MITRDKFEKMHIWEKLDALEKLIKDRNEVLEELEVSREETKYWKETAQNYEQEAKSLRRENNALKALLVEIKQELNNLPQQPKVVTKIVEVEKPIVVEKIVENPRVKDTDEREDANDNKPLKKKTSFDVKLSQLKRCLDRYA